MVGDWELFLCAMQGTVGMEVIGLVLLGNYNKCLPISSANSEANAHSAANGLQSCTLFHFQYAPQICALLKRI